MRYVKIFLLNYQQALVNRSLSFVWFLTAFFDIGIIIIFWFAVVSSTRHPIKGWGFSDLSSYYLFALVANQLIMSHQEFDVAKIDIKEGNLAAYLLKPFSYLGMKFFQEFAWRVMAGGLALLTVGIFLLVFRLHLIVAQQALVFLIACCTGVLGFCISFLCKMILGISAFWITEARGLFETVEVITVVFVGNLMPLHMLPNWLAHIAYSSPFAYIIYFPVIAIEGKLSLMQLSQVLLIQSVWIIVLFIAYQKLWNAGIKTFSAVGQ